MNTAIVHHLRRCALLVLILLSAGLGVALSGSGAAPPALARSEPVQAGKDAASPQRPPEVRCAPEWSEWPAPDTGLTHTQFMGIVALSRVDVWAVGSYLSWPYRPLITHWDGSAWSTVFVPGMPGAAVLRDVSAVSATDIWAVGYYDSGNRRWRPLTLHWNGQGWSQADAPDPGTGSSYLFGVRALATNDVWAVGSACCVRYLQQTLALHWNGATWSVVPTPSTAGSNNSLNSVDGVATNDVWAVGASGKYEARQTLLEHWDGTTWSTATATIPGALLSVVTLSSDKAWAAGYVGSSYSSRTLVLRFNGTTWEVAPSPGPGDESNMLYSLDAVSENDIWAVGSFRNAYSPNETLIVHWDGGRWTQVPSPTRGYEDTLLYDIAVSAPDDSWAVGETYGFEDAGRVFLARYVSSLPFRDVTISDYYYEAVRYLYCRGVVSGYADGTFHPYNNTTRAQISKLVVLAEGWLLYGPSTPTFSDVPLTNPFYAYIETAYHKGVVSGYSDGTFRPGNDVTRGQLAKIVVLAEQWLFYIPPFPTFSDVPYDHPLLPFIETAYYRHIIAGYSDHTFRPNNSATRGQISKIVYNAITSP